MHEVCSCGLPHSEICGSAPICGSPQLIAACRVLRRLPVPRHPPCALFCLTIIAFTFYIRFSLVSLARTLSGLSRMSARLSGLPGCYLFQDNDLDSLPICVLRMHLLRCTLLQDYFVYAVFKVRSGFLHSGDEGIRTLDPLLAGQVLSQLSYTPRVILLKITNGLKWTRTTDLTLIRRAL